MVLSSGAHAEQTKMCAHLIDCHANPAVLCYAHSTMDVTISLYWFARCPSLHRPRQLLACSNVRTKCGMLPGQCRNAASLLHQCKQLRLLVVLQPRVWTRTCRQTVSWDLSNVKRLQDSLRYVKLAARFLCCTARARLSQFDFADPVLITP
jgi:hypothetical protein